MMVVAGGLRIAAAPAPTPRVDWQFDGRVWSTARAGDTLFVAGEFRNAAPTSGAVGSVYALSPTTGAIVPSGLPVFNDTASAIVPDGSGGYYLAGAFTNVGPPSASPTRVVRVDSGGAVDPAFQMPATVSGNIMAMARVGPSLVVGGFLRVNGVDRALAALDPLSGALSPWTPVLPAGDTVVWDMETANGLVFVLSGGAYGPTRYVTAFAGVSGAQVWQTDITGAPGFSGTGRLAIAGGRLIVGVGRLYSLDAATGVVDTAWAAGQAPTSAILGLAVNGTTVYVSGPFTVFHGQPRGRLAAVDLATGNVLPWAPQASDGIAAIAPSPTGGVFLGVPYGPTSPPTVNGVTRAGIWEIDAAGVVTPFTAEAVAATINLLERAPNGALLVSGATAFAGKVARVGLAAMDVNTNALLPAAVTVTAAVGPPSVRHVVAQGGTLYLSGLFDQVNGQARAGVAAVDAATGTVLPWQPAGISVFSLDFAANGWIYVTESGGTFPWRRVDAATGAVDPVWRPGDARALMLSPVGGELMTWGRITSSGCNTGSILGTLDPVTGAFREWFRTTAFNSAQLTSDGDTIYLAGAVPNFQPGGCYAGSALFAYDRRTGVQVDAPPLAGAINSLHVVDGRLFAAGGAMSLGATPVNGLVELLRPGSTGFVRADGFTATVHGDLIVGVGGATNSAIMRVVGYGTTGTSVPSNVRAHAAGANTVVTWDAMAVPPAGGYVIEGGFAAGQTAAALPVGNATSVTLPLSAGPIFIRVRPQGSSEVSNEIVAGCVAPPLPPTALTTTLNGTTLTLSWTAPAGAVTNYTLLAGSASGLTDVATLPVGALTSASGQVPGGTFFARVTASNPCGRSGPSGEVFFTIGAPDALPAAPTNLTSTVAGSTLTLSWTAPPGPVTGYVLEAGSAPGLANIGAATIGAITSFVIPGVPAGIYYVRARAITSAGSGAPSADVVIVVP